MKHDAPFAQVGSGISSGQTSQPMSPNIMVREIEMSREQKVTATVPKMAPLAPTDGTPTREKLPPRTLLGHH